MDGTAIRKSEPDGWRQRAWEAGRVLLGALRSPSEPGTAVLILKSTAYLPTRPCHIITDLVLREFHHHARGSLLPQWLWTWHLTCSGQRDVSKYSIRSLRSVCVLRFAFQNVASLWKNPCLPATDTWLSWRPAPTCGHAHEGVLDHRGPAERPDGRLQQHEWLQASTAEPPAETSPKCWPAVPWAN